KLYSSRAFHRYLDQAKRCLALRRQPKYLNSQQVEFVLGLLEEFFGRYGQYFSTRHTYIGNPSRTGPSTAFLEASCMAKAARSWIEKARTSGETVLIANLQLHCTWSAPPFESRT